MTIWRPAARIRYKALGMHWRGDKLLAAEIEDDTGRVKGVRPLGGTVEFGETSEEALRREFKEELDVEITVESAPFFMENIYRHEGYLGHEILALYTVNLPKDAFANQTRIRFSEDNGQVCSAQWYDLSDLDQADGPALYPTGLKQLLVNRAP
ncbi:MAG: NUDIX domain-containing protein [Marinovum sp.]|nr:NUDIX domain-containing protein [Marinovum sp.]